MQVGEKKDQNEPMNAGFTGLEATNAAVKTPAQKLEGVAFTFCKVATVALIAGRYTLPVAGLFSASLYIAAHFKGQRESRCILKWPLLIAAFWILISTGWLFAVLEPQVWARFFSAIHWPY
jgi:hypothetical protein